MKKQLSSINGTVQAYLVNPNGKVDGLLLSDGKQLHLPPHLSTILQQVIQPGHSIQATVEPGLESTFGQEFRILSVTNSLSMQTVVNQPPVTKLPESLEEQSPCVTVEGSVDRWLVGHKGELKGLILSDGTQLHIPPHLKSVAAAQIKIGDRVSAQGYGTFNNLSQSLAVTNLSVNEQPLSEHSHAGAKHDIEAVEHHEKAAKHHLEAAKHYKTGDPKKASHHAHKAEEHHRQAMQYAEKIAKKHDSQSVEV